MYMIDDFDSVVPLEGVPPIDTGAPEPALEANGHGLRLSYFTREDTRTTLEFDGSHAIYFGDPNDDCLGHHPLYGRGLSFYKAFEVLNSSWIRRLMRLNSGHTFYRPETYKEYHHYIFAFHDNTFECIAVDFRVTSSIVAERHRWFEP